MSPSQSHHRAKIVDAAPVTVFTATNTVMLDYPHVLGRPEESSPTLAENCDTYIMDSGIGNDMTNSEVLERARSVDADVVVPKDVIGDPMQTTENVLEMLDLVDDMSVLLPLQESSSMSHEDHYDLLSDEMSRRGYNIREHRVAVGGIRDKSVHEQILCCARVRNHVGEQQHLHAFGCGIHRDWVVAIREWPALLDSLDTSSAERCVTNGGVFDTTLSKTSSSLPRGRHSTCLYAARREVLLYMFCHIISPLADERDVPTTFDDEQFAEAFDEAVGQPSQ